MSVGWLLYYAMMSTHLCGLIYVWVFGRVVHRCAALVLSLAFAVQILICSASVLVHIPVQSIEVSVDIVDNTFISGGFLVLALIFKRDNWIIALLMLSATQLALDGLVFEDSRGFSQLDFPGTANVVNILMIGALVAASAALQRRLGWILP